MTEFAANAHLTDDHISDLLDERLPSGEAAAPRAHVTACPGCMDKLAQAQTVRDLLRRLPDVPLPRDFRLTDGAAARLVALPDPPNLVRLRRWYGAARVTSAALAAAFLALCAATLYVDSQPMTPATSASVPSRQSDVAPNVGPQAPTPMKNAGVPSGGAPASAAGAPAISRVVRPSPVTADGESSDQQAATTTVGPLPTQVPTPAPLPTRIAVTTAPAVASSAPSDAPWRIAAGVCGVLAVVGFAAARSLRRRLHQSLSPLPE